MKIIFFITCVREGIQIIGMTMRVNIHRTEIILTIRMTWRISVVKFSREPMRQKISRDKMVFQLLSLNFDDLGSFKGIYLIQVASSERQWQNSTKMLSISDIGLIVKQSDDDILVLPIPLRLPSHFPVPASRWFPPTIRHWWLQWLMVTGSDIQQSEIKSNDFQFPWSRQKHDNDFNFITFADARVNTSRFDVGGRRADETGMMAFYMATVTFIVRVKQSTSTRLFAQSNGKMWVVYLWKWHC